MNVIPVNRRVNNLEILSKLMNSIAKQCDCRVKYDKNDNTLCFSGDASFRKHIAEETMGFFRSA
jgi:hypothetical protein